MTDEDRDRAQLLRAVRGAARRRLDADDRFVEAIQRAAAVAPQRAVAEACGLSLTRVNQIVHGRNR